MKKKLISIAILAALSVSHVLADDSDDPVAGANFKFTTEYLNGKTLYNVFTDYDDEDNDGSNRDLVAATFKFTDSELEGRPGIDDQSTEKRLFPYFITDNGYLQFGGSVVRVLEVTPDRLNLCWSDTVLAVSDVACSDNNGGQEYFYFDKSKAREQLLSDGDFVSDGDGVWQSGHSRDGYYYYFEVIGGGRKIKNITHEGCSINIEEEKNIILDEWTVFTNVVDSCDIINELHFFFSSTGEHQFNEVGYWGDFLSTLNPPGSWNNEGSAPNEEEPETPVATLTESLSIHIPELDYKIHHGEISKLDIYLNPAPSIEGRLTWQLESFSNVVCSSTGNNCSNNFQAATASSDEVEEHVPFDIHIPKITYNGTQYWANLKFFGISGGNYIWQLGQYGVPEISSFPTTCNFPYAHWSGLDSISNPTCEQKWNLWNYHQLGSALLRNDFNVLYAKYEGILDRRAYNAKITEIAQRTIEVVSFAGSIASSATGAAGELIGGSAEEIAGGLIPIVTNNLTRYISDDSGYLSAVFEVRGIVSDAIIAIGNSGGNPVIATLSIGPSAMDKIQTAIAAYRTGELVEKLNEINIASEYLTLYYSFGSNAEDASYKYTGNRSSSFENIIIAVADELKLKNRWYGDDYNYDQVVEIINHYKNNVIPDITRITSNQN